MGVCRVPGRSYLVVTVTVIVPIFPPGCVGNWARFTSLLQARIVCFPPSTWVSRWRPSAEFGIQTAALALHGAANEQNRTLHMHEKLISTRFFTHHHSTCPGASLLSRAPVHWIPIWLVLQNSHCGNATLWVKPKLSPISCPVPEGSAPGFSLITSG